VEWHRKGRRLQHTTHPIHNKQVTYYRTTKRSYYKTTTNTLPIVVICHPLYCNVAAKKCAFTAHIMRDKRAISFIQYVVGDKKAANTPPIFNYSATKNRRYFALGL
jgi:hypothetical protein